MSTPLLAVTLPRNDALDAAGGLTVAVHVA
jgi:hypothetical protein